jgi:tRNA A-37 threonylcarbamoyl transferase component Bud32
MKLLHSRYRRASRWAWARAITAAVVGAALGAFAIWWLVMGLLMVAFSEGAEEFRSSFLVTAVFGVGPGLWALAVLIWGGLGLHRLLRFRELVTLSRHIPSFRAADVARELQLPRREAELLLLDAAAAGIVEDGRESVAPTPTPPSPAPSADGPRRTAEPLAAREDLTGVVLNGTWRVERHLSSGGMGAVYRARHERTGKAYAVKLLHADARLSESAIRRFAREARAASALGHPGIVSILDFDVALDGTHFLVMELLEGETLEERLGREGSLPWPRALELTREIGVALGAAHQEGILHRDLKPANVFLCSDPQRAQTAVLLDFGLARPIDESSASKLTSTGMVLGTPAYMSPEQARGEELDVRSDVHAVGAILYEMVTGVPPFMDQTLAGIYARLLMATAPAASEVAETPLPPELDALIGRALAKARDDRHPTVADLLDEASRIEPLSS